MGSTPWFPRTKGRWINLILGWAAVLFSLFGVDRPRTPGGWLALLGTVTVGTVLFMLFIDVEAGMGRMSFRLPWKPKAES